MTTLTQVLTTQANKETTINNVFTAVSQAGLFGRKLETTSALTFGYYGGVVVTGSGTLTSIADGTLAMTNAATNYIEVSAAGTVSTNTSAFTAGRRPLYTVTTSGGAITAVTDWRTSEYLVNPYFAGNVSIGGNLAVTGTSTLTGTVAALGSVAFNASGTPLANTRLTINESTAGHSLMSAGGVAGNVFFDNAGTGNNYIDGASFNLRTFAGATYLLSNATGLTITGTATASGMVKSTVDPAALVAGFWSESATGGRLVLKRTASGADAKMWDIETGTANIMTFRALTDAGTGATTWLQITRSGISITGILSTSGSGSWDHTGAMTVSSTMAATGTVSTAGVFQAKSGSTNIAFIGSGANIGGAANDLVFYGQQNGDIYFYRNTAQVALFGSTGTTINGRIGVNGVAPQSTNGISVFSGDSTSGTYSIIAYDAGGNDAFRIRGDKLVQILSNATVGGTLSVVGNVTIGAGAAGDKLFIVDATSGNRGLQMQVSAVASWTLYTGNTNVFHIERSGVGDAITIDANRLITLTPSGNAVGLTLTTAVTNTVAFVSTGSAAASTAWQHYIGQSSGPTNNIIIYGNGNIQNTNNSYGAVSSRLVKQDIALAGSQWDDVKFLGGIISKFRPKADPKGPLQIGWIAEDVMDHCPGLVYKSMGDVFGIHYSVAYMKGMKALGEVLDWADDEVKPRLSQVDELLVWKAKAEKALAKKGITIN